MLESGRDVARVGLVASFAGAAALGLAATAPASSGPIPEPFSERPVQSAALAGDGDRLVAYMCSDDPAENNDEGIVAEWDGASWALTRNVSVECGEPDVAVSGAWVLATGRDVSGNLDPTCLGPGCAGQLEDIEASLARLHRTPRAGFAYQVPYATYTILQGGSTLEGLFVDRLFSGIGSNIPVVELGQLFEGGLHCFTAPFRCASSFTPTVSGDATSFVSAYVTSVRPCIGVRRNTGFPPSVQGGLIAECIDLASLAGQQGVGAPRAPEVEVVGGFPLVHWLQSDDTGTDRVVSAIYIAPDWFLLGGDLLAPAGTSWQRLRIDREDDDLFVVMQLEDGRIFARRWRFVDFEYEPFVQVASATASPGSLDIAVAAGEVHVAMVEQGTLKVVVVPLPEPSVPLLGIGAIGLLAGLRRARSAASGPVQAVQETARSGPRRP